MQHVLSDGLSLAVFDIAPATQDRGEPILLIHGFASNHTVNWVSTLWVKSLTQAGRRVILFDNRGHGRSGVSYDPAAYHPRTMARDAARVLDALAVARADVMGYSMGARIAAHLAVEAPERVRSLIIGGLGHHLIEGEGLPYGIAEALEAPSIADVTEPTQRMFRAFAEQTRSDLKALAACMRGSRFNLSADEFARIAVPSLICVGTADGIAGDPHALARLNARARAVDVPGRDHNLAVGDKAYKQSVLEFLESRP